MMILSYYCKFNCPYCIETSAKKNKELLVYDKAKRLLDSTQYSEIIIMGGEITELDDDFVKQFINLAKEKASKVIIYTTLAGGVKDYLLDPSINIVTTWHDARLVTYQNAKELAEIRPIEFRILYTGKLLKEYGTKLIDQALEVTSNVHISKCTTLLSNYSIDDNAIQSLKKKLDFLRGSDSPCASEIPGEIDYIYPDKDEIITGWIL